MLNVSYTNKIGSATLTQTSIRGTEKYRLDICHANCLCALMYFYTDPQKGEQAQLHAFFLDIKHLKACIKNGVLDGLDSFIFNAAEMNSDLWKMVRALSEAGKTVTINPNK